MLGELDGSASPTSAHKNPDAASATWLIERNLVATSVPATAAATAATAATAVSQLLPRSAPSSSPLAELQKGDRTDSQSELKGEQMDVSSSSLSSSPPSPPWALPLSVVDPQSSPASAVSVPRVPARVPEDRKRWALEETRRLVAQLAPDHCQILPAHEITDSPKAHHSGVEEAVSVVAASADASPVHTSLGLQASSVHLCEVNAICLSIEESGTSVYPLLVLFPASAGRVDLRWLAVVLGLPRRRISLTPYSQVFLHCFYFCVCMNW